MASSVVRYGSANNAKLISFSYFAKIVNFDFDVIVTLHREFPDMVVWSCCGAVGLSGVIVLFGELL